MAWENSLESHIWIFSIGRGNAAFVRLGLNQGLIADMGAGNDFDPATFIEKRLVPKLDPYGKGEDKDNKIAQIILSHPHSDHISQCARSKKGDKLYPTLLTCPNDKDLKDGTKSPERINWNRITNPEGTEELLRMYKGLFATRTLPLQTILFESNRKVPNLDYGIYYIRPPMCENIHENNDQLYSNSTSMMFYFSHGDHSILFPGDMTPEGMKHVLEEKKGTEKRYTIFDRQSVENNPTWHQETSNQPSLKSLLGGRGLSILVASHHGLESGFSDDLYDAMKGKRPRLVVISERRHKKKTDGSIHPRYQKEEGAAGLNVETEGKVEKRRSVSTVNGHHILIVFSGTGIPKVYAHKDAETLLTRL